MEIRVPSFSSVINISINTCNANTYRHHIFIRCLSSTTGKRIFESNFLLLVPNWRPPPHYASRSAILGHVQMYYIRMTCLCSKLMHGFVHASHVRPPHMRCIPLMAAARVETTVCRFHEGFLRASGRMKARRGRIWMGAKHPRQ